MKKVIKYILFNTITMVLLVISFTILGQMFPAYKFLCGYTASCLFWFICILQWIKSGVIVTLTITECNNDTEDN